MSRFHGILIVALLVLTGLAGADGSVDYDAWADLTSDMVLDYQTLNTTVTMCSCYYTGLVQASRDVPASNWSGYEIDLARAAFEIVAKGGDVQMRLDKINWVTGPCGYWGLLFTALGTNGSYGTRPCDIYVGGADQTLSRIKAGVIFSTATLLNERKVLVHVPSNRNLWVFLRPFTASLWLLMFGTSVFAATVVWLFETKIEHFRDRPKFFTRKLEGYLFSATGLMLQGIKEFKIKTDGSRLFTLCYCFLVLVLMNTYIAVISSQLTSSALSYKIQSVNDIIGLKVGIFDGDSVVQARYKLQNPTLFRWFNRDDEIKMIEALRNGDIDALLMDAAFSDYYSTITCDVYKVGDIVTPVDMALAMAIDTPTSRVNAINDALVALKQQCVYDSLQSKYLGTGLQGCGDGNSYASLTRTQLKLADMGGLWEASIKRWAEKPSPSWSRSSRASRSSIKVNNRVCPDIEEGGPLGEAVDRRRRLADDPPAQTSEATLDNGADGLIIISDVDHE